MRPNILAVYLTLLLNSITDIGQQWKRRDRSGHKRNEISKEIARVNNGFAKRDAKDRAVMDESYALSVCGRPELSATHAAKPRKFYRI